MDQEPDLNSPHSNIVASCVRKRQVYYVHGFDARGPRFYHPLYRDGAAAQDVINSTSVAVGELEVTGEFAASWTIKAQSSEGEVVTRYTFLRWDDMVRAYWSGSRLAVAWQALQFYVAYALSGAMSKLWHCSKRYTGSVVSPLVFGALAVLASVVCAVSIAAAIGYLAPGWGNAGKWVVSVLAGCLLLWGALWWSDKLRLLWLARAWVFLHKWAHDRDAAIEARWKAFAAHIAADAGAEEADEILLIGHSAGTWVVISVLAELLALPQGKTLLPRLRLMTLGQVVPMMSFCSGAHRFRQQVDHVVAASVPWLDFTAPSDPLCTALASPLDGSGVSLASVPKPAVVVRSARFDRMFDAGTFKRLAADPFRIHFQYLMATDLRVANDYFSITAGPWPLGCWMGGAT